MAFIGKLFNRDKEDHKKALEAANAKLMELEEARTATKVPLGYSSPTFGSITTTSSTPSWAISAAGIPTPKPQITITDVLKFCIANDLWIRRTGSQLVKDVIPNDYDYVVEDTEGILEPWLEANGFWRGGSEIPETQFGSWKTPDGKLNIIVCYDREFFKKYLVATELLKKLQPKTKAERIGIFDSIMGRNIYEGVPL